METVSPVTSNKVHVLGTGIITNSSTTAHFKVSQWSFFQATISGSGSVSATVTIEGSNDGTTWAKTALGTITLSGTTSTSDGVTIISPVKYVRATIASISGTGATVSVTMAV